MTSRMAAIAFQRLSQRGHAHGRHAPDREFDGTAMHGAIAERCRLARGRARRSRLARHSSRWRAGAGLTACGTAHRREQDSRC